MLCSHRYTATHWTSGNRLTCRPRLQGAALIRDESNTVCAASCAANAQQKEGGLRGARPCTHTANSSTERRSHSRQQPRRAAGRAGAAGRCAQGRPAAHRRDQGEAGPQLWQEEDHIDGRHGCQHDQHGPRARLPCRPRPADSSARHPTPPSRGKALHMDTPTQQALEALLQGAAHT